MSSRLQAWLYRLLAVLIALALWYVTAFEKREVASEKSIEASLTYNVPRGFVVLNRTSQVRVVIRGNAREIRRLRPYDVDVLVELSEAAPGPLTLTLTADNVSLPSDSLQVVSIDPKSLKLDIDRERTRRVGIEVILKGEPAAGSMVVGRRANPTEVEITGPGRLVNAVRRVTTEPVNLDGHAFSFRTESGLLPPDPAVRLEGPRTVTVEVDLEQPASGSRREDG